MLDIDGLTKSFGSTAVLEDFDLSVGGGEIVALVGANGVGKSTVLECVAGATPADRGTVTLCGSPSDTSSSPHWRSVYAMLDDFAWLPRLTVFDHLMLLSPQGDTDAVRTALRAFGVEEYAERLPESLSTGQRQRAMLSTALVRPWTVLLLDEPERRLDSEGAELLAAILPATLTEDRCAVLASHSSALVAALECRTVRLERHERA